MIEEERIVSKPGSEEQRPEAGTSKAMPPAAKRALAEAAERRAAENQVEGAEVEKTKEVGGRTGPEPTRYGDWEKGGIVSDF